MKRKYNLRKITSKRSYTTFELAELLSVHIQTIRVWKREGLKPIEDSLSPYLYYGNDVKSFLKQEQDKQKIPLKPNECCCLKCRKAVVPTNPQIIDRKIKLGNGNSSAFLTGNCPDCGRSLRKFTSLDNSNNEPRAVENKDNSALAVENKKISNIDGQISLFSFEGDK